MLTKNEKLIEVAKQVLATTNGRGVFALINELYSTKIHPMVESAAAIETVLGANGSCFVISDGGGRWQFLLPKSTECERTREDWKPILKCVGYYLPRGTSDWNDQSEVSFNVAIATYNREVQQHPSIETFKAFEDALKVLEDSSKESLEEARKSMMEAIDEWFPLPTVKKEEIS